MRKPRRRWIAAVALVTMLSAQVRVPLSYADDKGREIETARAKPREILVGPQYLQKAGRSPNSRSRVTEPARTRNRAVS